MNNGCDKVAQKRQRDVMSVRLSMRLSVDTDMTCLVMPSSNNQNSNCKSTYFCIGSVFQIHHTLLTTLFLQKTHRV